MADYWLSFWKGRNSSYALSCMRIQNWKEYLLSVSLMLPWMAVYDSTNYTRYMSIYWVEMYNLNEDAKSCMEKGLFTASLTGLPFSAIPRDQ